MDLIRHFEKQQIKDTQRPNLRAGDIIRIKMKVSEGDKTRLQTFEGVVLGVRGSGPSTTLTVRREAGGFAVERIFPLYLPLISTIEIVRRQKVRRAKLTYLRDTKRRRVKEDVDAMTQHHQEEADKQKAAAPQDEQPTEEQK